MRHARVRRITRLLQTPVRFYRHPGTGRRVTLIGTIHVGTAAYFTALRTVISEQEALGAVVHAEDFRRGGLPDDATEQEREFYQVRTRLGELTSPLITQQGWTGQPRILSSDAWQVHDLPVIEVIRRAGVANLLPSATRSLASAELMHRNPAKAPYKFRAMTAVALRIAASNNAFVQAIARQKTDAIVVDERTHIALSALHASNDDVVLVWGAQHLPGFDASLLDRGYRLDTETWHTVMRLPSITAAVAGLASRRHPTSRHPDTASTDAATPTHSPDEADVGPQTPPETPVRADGQGR